MLSREGRRESVVRRTRLSPWLPPIAKSGLILNIQTSQVRKGGLPPLRPRHDATLRYTLLYYSGPGRERNGDQDISKNHMHTHVPARAVAVDLWSPYLCIF